MLRFDENEFLRLSGLDAIRYANDAESSHFPGLDDEIVARLLARIDSLSEEHATFVILWGIDRQIQGICDHAVRFLNRDAPWHGPQITIIRLLHRADELTEQHVLAIRPGPPRLWEGLPCPDGWTESLEILLTRVRERDERRKDAGSEDSSG